MSDEAKHIPELDAPEAINPTTKLEHALREALSDMLGLLEATEFDAALEDAGDAEIGRARYSAARRLVGIPVDDYARKASDWAYNDYLAVHALLQRTPPPAAEPTLEDQLRHKLHKWLARTAPLVRDEMDYAKFTVTISSPQSEDDGTLYLDFAIEEKSGINDGEGGRVPGVRL